MNEIHWGWDSQSAFPKYLQPSKYQQRDPEMGHGLESLKLIRI